METNLNKQQLRAALRELGMAFPAEANRAELQKILDLENHRRWLKRAHLQSEQGLRVIRKKRNRRSLTIDKPQKKRVKKWFEKFRWLKSSDGFLILGGKDVKTNEILVKKHMNDNDIFIHASFAGAPAIIIQTEGKEVPKQSIFEGAELAISYSGAWKAGYSQADAFWVKGSQVTFTPPSGEYRKKGSFIIEGTKNNMKAVPAKIKIGVKIEDKYIYPVISPNLEQKNILFPVEICPGDLKSSILAKQIKSFWISNVKDTKLRNKINRINIDEIQRLIPTGKGKIKEIV